MRDCVINCLTGESHKRSKAFFSVVYISPGSYLLVPMDEDEGKIFLALWYEGFHGKLVIQLS